MFADHLAIWDRLGEEDPFWAVLSDPAKRGGGWDPEAFFATGREHIAELEEELQGMGLSFTGRRALDFGCGLGRLTQAIAATASFALGVDASVGMVVGAQRWNGRPDRCAYLLNRSTDLGMLPDRSFGAVVSFIVLQHIPPPVGARYLTELARLVAPGGFLVVQVPAEPVMVGLPDAAFRSQMRLLDAPHELPAGAATEVVVEVTNASDQRWEPRPRGRLRVGNHWVGLNGGPSVEDGRAVLEPLDPGGTAVVRLPIVGPDRPGRYCLEVDVVLEGQAWFASQGNRPLRQEVRVLPAVPSTGATAPAAPPVSFGMWGIARPEAVGILEGAGLRVAQVAEDGKSGDEWISWRYLAVRPEAPPDP